MIDADYSATSTTIKCIHRRAAWQIRGGPASSPPCHQPLSPLTATRTTIGSRLFLSAWSRLFWNDGSTCANERSRPGSSERNSFLGGTGASPGCSAAGTPLATQQVSSGDGLIVPHPQRSRARRVFARQQTTGLVERPCHQHLLHYRVAAVIIIMFLRVPRLHDRDSTSTPSRQRRGVLRAPLSQFCNHAVAPVRRHLLDQEATRG